MERGSDKHSPELDDKLKEETEALERSLKEPHVEEFLEKEAPGEDELSDDASAPPGEPASGHRIAGTGSSAESYSYTDRGEEGGSSHPKPKDEEEHTEPE